jgi:hypothetical protein
VATVNAADNNAGFFLRLDDGTTLYPKNTSGIEVKDLNRMYVVYSLEDTQQEGYDAIVKLNQYSYVLTKDLFFLDNSEQQQDSIGNDPVHITAIWIGDDFLNVFFTIRTGYDNISHRINMVDISPLIYPIPDGIRRLYLQFRHNAMNDNPYAEVNSIAAFRLHNYTGNMAKGDSLLISIHSLDYNNKEYTYERKYIKR